MTRLRRTKARAMVPVALLLVGAAVSAATSAGGDWSRTLGSHAIEASFDTQAASLLRSPLTRERIADEAQACAAFVNAFKLSADVRFEARAREIADFLVANADLAGDGRPGWGPKLDLGYGFCPDQDDFRGKDLWETTRAIDCLLKVNEIRPSAAYVDLAKHVVDEWPSVDKRLANEGPYAAAGMRFYYKDAQSCARKYVKNTNIAMSESLFRLARQSHDKHYLEIAEQTLNAEEWEIVTRRNFGYHGAMIYVEPNDPHNQQILQHERPKVETDPHDNIVCRSAKPDPSCWNHLAFEAYELYQTQLLSGRNLGDPIDRIMSRYRSSPLGDTRRFDWQSTDSPTHITAYNCYLRNSGPAIYRDECSRALEHGPRGSMIFYSLVPDDLAPARSTRGEAP